MAYELKQDLIALQECSNKAKKINGDLGKKLDDIQAVMNRVETDFAWKSDLSEATKVKFGNFKTQSYAGFSKLMDSFSTFIDAEVIPIFKETGKVIEINIANTLSDNAAKF